MGTVFQQAQKYEAAYWLSRQRDPVGIIKDIDSPFMLAQHLQSAGYLKMRFKRFLDVGCGGMGLGIIWLINADKKYGLDPLPVLPPESGCPAMDRFVRDVQSAATYVKQPAESLPFEDGHFDFIVCNNVLDHVSDPNAILSEIRRCLAPTALFGFAVDTHSIKGFIGKKLLRRFRPGYGSLVGHPYEWTEPQMTAFLLAHGFTIESHQLRSFRGHCLGNVRRSTWLLRKS